MSSIVVVGGGVIGSSAAYHLALAGAAADTIVVEPDPTYEYAATPRSVGGVRVQFSIPECIRMSQYGHDVYGAFETLMAVDAQAPSLSLVRRGYLYLGGGNADVQRLQQAASIQREQGAVIELLDADTINARWPSISTHDVDIGSFSPGDAIIDPYAAVIGFRKKANSLGVTYLKDRVVDLHTSKGRIDSVLLESGQTLQADYVINAANCWAPEICAMVGMKIPVEPMRRMCFYYDCQTEIEDLPLMRHVSAGDGFRPEGAGYLTGISRYDEPRGFNWSVDYELFDDILWPGLARRIGAFEAVKLQRAWSCHYDQNSLDANMILGAWRGQLDNFYIACGLSGHGLQHAPAIGRALKELIVDGGYQSLDLSRFGYQRIVDNQPIEDISVLS